MTANPVYCVVTTTDGKTSAEFFNDMAAVEIRYGAPVAFCNRRGLRAELYGQPQFAGLVGPMWGGHTQAHPHAPIVRYEDSETNDRMSA